MTDEQDAVASALAEATGPEAIRAARDIAKVRSFAQALTAAANKSARGFSVNIEQRLALNLSNTIRRVLERAGDTEAWT